MNRFGDIDCSFKKLTPVYGFHSAKVVSLEEALQPIEPQINELSRYIKIAKKSCHFPNDHGLSKDQSASIYIYTMEWGETTLYRVLNQALRSENRQALKIWFPYLKLFDTALELLPTVKESVWRGVPLDIGKNFTKNQIFTWWAVSSCSSSVNVIETFLQNAKSSTLFLIEVVNGKKISGYTEYEAEDEVILKIGTEFRVKDDPLKRSDSSYTVHLVETHDDQPAASVPNELKSNVLKWKFDGQTIAGGNGYGDKLNQLCYPNAIYVDHQQQHIYIADCSNYRIIKLKLDGGSDHGEIVAGGNGKGNRIDQLNQPTDVIVDENNKSLIICDLGNQRVVRWSLENSNGDIEILIENIQCWGLMMNQNGDLFVSDRENHSVKRWRKGEIGKEGRIVAGGNGWGDKLNQLHRPTYIFVDREETIYVSDLENHRIMKWLKDASEGIIVAGGQGQGNSLKQLDYPMGLVVNEVGDIYVADCVNDRIMCWSLGSKEGRIVIGVNGKGKGLNQFNLPRGLSFDIENNLYVADGENHRIQRFRVD